MSTVEEAWALFGEGEKKPPPPSTLNPAKATKKKPLSAGSYLVSRSEPGPLPAGLWDALADARVAVRAFLAKYGERTHHEAASASFSESSLRAMGSVLDGLVRKQGDDASDPAGLAKAFQDCRDSAQTMSDEVFLYLQIHHSWPHAAFRETYVMAQLVLACADLSEAALAPELAREFSVEKASSACRAACQAVIMGAPPKICVPLVKISVEATQGTSESPALPFSPGTLVGVVAPLDDSHAHLLKTAKSLCGASAPKRVNMPQNEVEFEKLLDTLQPFQTVANALVRVAMHKWPVAEFWCVELGSVVLPVDVEKSSMGRFEATDPAKTAYSTKISSLPAFRASTTVERFVPMTQLVEKVLAGVPVYVAESQLFTLVPPLEDDFLDPPFASGLSLSASFSMGAASTLVPMQQLASWSYLTLISGLCLVRLISPSGKALFHTVLEPGHLLFVPGKFLCLVHCLTPALWIRSANHAD